MSTTEDGAGAAIAAAEGSSVGDRAVGPFAAPRGVAAAASGIDLAAWFEGGVVAPADEVRSEIAATVDRLRSIGIEEISMRTGDRAVGAWSIGRRPGIDRVVADLKPEDELQAIERPTAERATAMVGDGVNDAPVLARPDMGTAIGRAGSDLPMETADVVLIGHAIGRLPDAVELSRRARRVATRSVVIALGVIAIVVPLVLPGHASLPPAVLVHDGSTVVGVLNDLRLLGFRSRGVAGGPAGPRATEGRP